MLKRAVTAFGGVMASERGVDGVQIVKIVVATVLAWWLSHDVLRSELVFLAPWTALMTVHATVARSVRLGMQTLVAATLGVGVSFLVVAPLGVTLPSIALALTIGMLLSRLPWLLDEGVAVATTTLFVMAGHTQDQVGALAARLLDVLVGVVVGVLVNMAVAPPLRDRQAETETDEVTGMLGRLLVSMAHDLDVAWTAGHADAWIRRTVELDAELDRVAAKVELAQESGRWNLRRRLRSAPERQSTLGRLYEAVSHVRHLVRTLGQSTYDDSRWDDEFRSRWTATLRGVGENLPTGPMAPYRDDLDRLAADISTRDLAGLHWPVYGSLIVSLRHLTLIMDDAGGRPDTGR